MSTLPTPPPEVVNPTVPNRDQLLERIDVHLERYLELLDQYQALRKELANSFSSGFISLAQANFNAPGRTRYGEDHYDDRTKASKRVQLSSGDSGNLNFNVAHLELTSKESKKTDDSPKSEETASKKEGVKHNAAASVDSDANLDPTHADSTQEKPQSDKPSATSDEEIEIISDPIRWFGLFVPPALRTSQKHFTNAVDGPVPKLCKVIREMRTLESEIGRTRKQVKKLT